MNSIRNGNFTSSEIVALLSNGKQKGSFGKPALAYIEEKHFERKLGKSLSSDNDSKACSWGSLLEGYVFDQMGMEYKLCSTETIGHPEIECWKGSPDGEKFDEGKTVFDIKCPYTLKAFCQLIDYWQEGGMDAIRAEYRDGEKYYWQIVSNACLTGARYGELIVFVPYQSELEAIRELARNYDGEKQHRFRWIDLAADDEMPHLLDGGHYKNLNTMRFEIPLTDKQLLTERVKDASKLLYRVEILA